MNTLLETQFKRAKVAARLLKTMPTCTKNQALDKIADALKTNKITEADKELWTGRLTKDFDEWSKELDAKATPKQFEKKIGNGNTGEPAKTGNPILDAIAQQNQSAAINIETK